jgi:NAD(P)H-dependent FMN reductase
MDHGQILIISGTNRPDSSAAKVAKIVMGHYQSADIQASMLSLLDLGPEIFAPAAYAKKPQSMVALQERIYAAAGLHVVTPEYNGSFPGALKYFIDLLKFPQSFDRKPVALVGESDGMWGALRAVEHLQGIFGYRNAHIYPDRVFIPQIKQKLDEQGKLTDKEIDGRLAKQAIGFARFAHLLRA